MPKSGPIKWHGGKSYLAPKIIALMPPHTRYCEPFFGGGAVLLQKPCEGVAEFANDLNRELTDFWRVLANVDWFPRFHRFTSMTPFSAVEFEDATKPDIGIVDRAGAFFVRNRQSRQGLMKDFATPTGRLRRGMNEQVSAWLSAVEGLPEFHARLKRVEIRCMDAKEFIRELDSPETCFYCDPPYLHETRHKSATDSYQHEMSEEGHHNLLCCLKLVKGKVLLSGYRSAMYDDHLSKWRRVDIEIPNQASSKREKEIKTECVWMNY